MASGVDDADHEPDLGALLGRLLPVLLDLEAPILESESVSMWEYVILTELLLQASVSQAELSTRTGRDPTRLGKHLTELEGRSLVERSRSEDQRALLVALTADGRRVVESAKRSIRAAEDRLLADRLGSDAGAELRGLLRRLTQVTRE